MKIDVIGGGPAGLYFALLAKKADSGRRITVHERNPEGVTWGWGVVFSDETLERFAEADRESHDLIVADFARWEAIDVIFKGRTIRSGGHAFCGIRRMRLLSILQERCRDVGVDLRFGTEVEEVDALAGSDLVVAADGVNSRVRTALAAQLRPDIVTGASPYIWLATSRVFASFTFIIRENEHGLFQVHAYPFDATTSTFIVETDDATWRRAGLDTASENENLAYCEKLFAPELQGHRLMSNSSAWIRFRRVACERWRHGNVVLMGDAAHTAHFSIGSGTKMAMEDSIALSSALDSESDMDVALARYEEVRRIDVIKRQRAAEVSQRWFEEIARYKHYEPEPFAVALLCRSRKVTHGNLKMRDPVYIESVDRWFASRNGSSGKDPQAGPPELPPPPMFAPLTLRGLTITNRVVVSPMCMYSAQEGMPDDFHLVHLGSRAIGGAGLVITEMTDVSRAGRITPGCAGIYTDTHVAAWKRIVDFVHRFSDAKIAIQLAHAGRKGSTKLMWDGIDEPLSSGNWPLISASPIPWDAGSQTPREVSRAEMDEVRDQFVAAARRSSAAGFDMLELHFAHGYLLSSFLSPLTNRREDEYGGESKARMRYPLEVFDAVRAAWPEDRPMSVRISATDWAEGGADSADAVMLARALKDHGCDIVDVSSGMTTPQAQPRYGTMFQTGFADRIRNEAGIPTMAVGNIQNYDQVNTILVSGYADLVVLGRPHLADPYFTLHAAAAQGFEGVRWPEQYLPAKPRPRR